MDTDEKLRSQKRRITGNLAHELRTPVTSIRGYLETLVNNPDIQQDKRVLFTERAYLQTLRLSDMIRDISLITKIEEAPELLIKEHLGILSHPRRKRPPRRGVRTGSIHREERRGIPRRVSLCLQYDTARPVLQIYDSRALAPVISRHPGIPSV